jgi:hypothetical protein
MRLLQVSFGDDTVIEPWLTMRAAHVLPPEGVWGIGYHFEHYDGDTLAFHVAKGALDAPGETEKLTVPVHRIDETKTAENLEKLQSAIGDIMEINLSRSPAWTAWNGDISTNVGYLRGHEQLFWDIMDDPEELHKLLAFMSRGVLKAQDEAENAGDWGLGDHHNQAMPYSKTLQDPKPNRLGVKRSELWGYFSAQEYESISPAHHEEFLLRYQMPIMEKYGMVAYGCCEDLTNKIDLLRKIPNLRRIAVTPFAHVEKCAEQIGRDYICSYRPNPSLVAAGYDEKNIWNVLRKDMAAFAKNGCYVDICLKDISTVEKDPRRMTRFTEIAKQVAEEYKA